MMVVDAAIPLFEGISLTRVEYPDEDHFTEVMFTRGRGVNLKAAGGITREKAEDIIAVLRSQFPED